MPWIFRSVMLLLVTGVSAFGVLSFSAEMARATTLESVRQNGDLRCGVFANTPGRSAINSDGAWQGFYVDFCRAAAAAVLGNPDFVRFVEVEYKSRFTVLQERQADVVMFSTTWTLGRELEYNVSFPAIYLYDGQGVMVRKTSGVSNLEDLRDKTVCAKENTTSYQNFARLVAERHWDTKIILIEKEFFFRGQCDAYTADIMNLATSRANRAEDRDEYVILPDVLSREPLGPMVRDDDRQWSLIIRSVVQALILAEEQGLTQDNVELVKGQQTNGELANMLGVDPALSEKLGLDPDWAVRAIQAVGNYGQIYDRHFGVNTPIGIARGMNRPWTKGGLLYVPLFR